MIENRKKATKALVSNVDASATSGRVIGRAMLLSFLIFSAGVTATGVQEKNQGASTDKKPTVKAHPRKKSWIKRTWGIEIEYVRRTAAGYMLEFRYRVLDPKKAAPLFARQTKPVLTHQRTGAKLVVPTPAKTGALRNSNQPLVDHTYWMFFANPAKLVQSGDFVDIEIGRFNVKGITVN